MRAIYSLLLVIITCISCTQTKDKSNPYGLTEEERSWMKEETLKQLKGCLVEGAGGVWIHTPDGIGHYKALWTRDYYYMVEYAGDLMDPAGIKESIQYLLDGQREDGCIPDRVNAEGLAIYSPGPPHRPMADHAKDNGPFMALLVTSYIRQTGDEEFFCKVESAVRKGLDQVHLGENGLVYNDPENPQCVYGFTDIVKKTGNLLFSSLLYYEACLEMAELSDKLGCGDPETYRDRAKAIGENISMLWDEKVGMFRAADLDCNQVDIWGSAFAVDVGIVTPEQEKRITTFLVENMDQVLKRGQVRHLPASDPVWQQLFHSCEPGTYQNGAYWATPLAWVIPAYAKQNPELAGKILKTVIADFRANGINECINDDYAKVPNFIVSATNVYSLTR